MELIQDDFLNELRFAQSYARGKFRMKKWGRIRIKQELKFRYVSDYCIKKAMQEIDDTAYQGAIYDLIEKKDKTLREKDMFKRRGKLAKHVIDKGFESFLVWAAVKELFPYE